MRREGTALSLFFPTVKGKSYFGEYTDTLPAANWQPLGSVPGGGAEQVIIDTNTMPTRRFFRITLTP